MVHHSYKQRKHKKKSERKYKRTKRRYDKRKDKKSRNYYFLNVLSNCSNVFLNQEDIIREIKQYTRPCEHLRTTFLTQIKWAIDKGYMKEMNMIIPLVEDPVEFDALEQICANLTTRKIDLIGRDKFDSMGLKILNLGYVLTSQTDILLRQEWTKKYIKHYEFYK